MAKPATYLIAIIISLLSLLGCKEKPMSQYPKYDWTPSESAPKEYVMQIINGHFDLADGSQKGIPTRVTLHNGWGTGRSTIVSGPDTLALPVGMEVTWFSYREDTFYRGKFEMPYVKIAKIHSEEFYPPYSDERSTGSTFVVGVAPEGFVVVWLSGGRGKRVIFTGFAEPVSDVPWEAVFNNPEFTKDEIMKSTIQSSIEDAENSPNLNDPKYWQRLHNETYHYDIVIESDYTPYSVGARFLDTTASRYYYDERHLWPEEARSVPEKISFAYIFPDRIPVVPIDNIDTDEMLAAFRHLSKDYEGVLKLVITVEGNIEGWGYSPRLRVENDKEAIEIKNFDFRAIDNSSSLKWLDGLKGVERFFNKVGQPAQL